MKKFLFIINMFCVGIAFTVYGMQPEPRDEARLFIRNKRPDAVVVTYQYLKEQFRGANLRRVIYPEEVIWINGLEAITSLKLSPHGVGWQYTDPEVWSLGFLKTEDYAERIKNTMKEKGRNAFGVEMTLSGSSFIPYSVDFKAIDISNIGSSNIGAVIPLDSCKLLGDIFVRAREAFLSKEPKKEPIKPEYILGVPAKPTKSGRDFNLSVDKAQADLIAGWSAAEYITKETGLLEQNEMLNLINTATRALRDGTDYDKFDEYARRLFEKSRRKYSEVRCPIIK